MHKTTKGHIIISDPSTNTITFTKQCEITKKPYKVSLKLDKYLGIVDKTKLMVIFPKLKLSDYNFICTWETPDENREIDF